MVAWLVQIQMFMTIFLQNVRRLILSTNVLIPALSFAQWSNLIIYKYDL